MFRRLFFTAVALSSGSLFAQSTWSFEHGSEELTVAADGSAQIGGDSLTFSLRGDGTVTIASEEIGFSVNVARSLMLGRTGSPDNARIRILTKRPASLTGAEMAGPWIYKEFAIEEQAGGPVLHGFETATLEIAVDAAGGIAIGGEPAGTYTIDARQHALVTVGGEVLDFSVSSSKDIMVSTTSEEGFHFLRVMVRPESGGTTADLAGPWTLGDFGVDQFESSFEFFIGAEDITVASDGSFPGEDGLVTLTPDGNGGVVATDDGETFDLVWNQSRDLLALAESLDGEHQLLLAVRRPSDLTLAQLAGTWDLHELSIENPNLTGNVAENFFPDGMLRERFHFIETPDEFILRDGLSTSFRQDTGLPENETNWKADPVAKTEVQHGLSRFFGNDGTTVTRTENWVDGEFDGTPAIQEWDEQGRLVLVENWTAGMITQSIQNAFNDPGDTDPLQITTLLFTDGALTSRRDELFYPGTTNLESLDLQTFVGDVITRRESTLFQADGLTKSSEYLVLRTPEDVIIETRSTQYLDDGIGLNSTDVFLFHPDGSRLSNVLTIYHEDGTTVQSRSTTTYPDGTITELSELFYPSGLREIERTTVDGELEGLATTWHPNGNVQSRRRYIAGELDGLTEFFNADGNPTRIANYTLDVLLDEVVADYYPGGQKSWERSTQYTGGITTHLYRTWHENGALETSSPSVNDFLNGLYEVFDSSSRPVLAETWVMGVRHGPYTRWYADSTQVQRQGSYANGERDGLWKEWHPDGTVRSCVNYSAGIQDGAASYFDAAGRRTSEQIWVDGKLRRRENWSYYQDGTLGGHSIRERSDGDLNRGDPAESAILESYDTDGRLSDYGEYSYGVRAGEYRSYHEGILTYRARFARNRLEGREESFYFNFEDTSDPNNGNLVTDREFRNGRLDGVSLIYDPETGTLLERTHYQRDKLHGLRELFFEEDGSPRFRGEYVEGLRNGLHTTWSTPGVLYQEQTYLEDILHGPSRTYSSTGILISSGSYKDGLKTGTWNNYDTNTGDLTQRTQYRRGFVHGKLERFSGGRIYARESYSDGVRDGLWEQFGENTNGSTYRSYSTDYQHGEEIGPRRIYHSNGRVSRFEPLVNGLVEGVVVNYYQSGRTQSRSDYESGIPQGSFTSWYDGGSKSSEGSYYNGRQSGLWRFYQPGGVRSSTGSYSQGGRCGTWTYYDGNGDFDRSENFGSCEPNDPVDFPIVRGLEGTVTAGAGPVPFAQVTLTVDGEPQSFNGSTAGDGSYRIAISPDVSSTAFTLRVFHPDFPPVEDSVSIPNSDGYATRSVSLTPYEKPSLSLGDPSVGGVFFLENINLPVQFDVDVGWGGAPHGSVIWSQDGFEEDFWWNRTISPGLDLDPGGGRASVIARGLNGSETPPTLLPDYRIYPQPTWTPPSGGWVVENHGGDGSPATYRFQASWPEEPVDLGISEDTLDPVGWALWSAIPVIGKDLGLFGIQFELDAKAHTNGTGDLAFRGEAEVKAAGKSLFLEADGEGDLLWGETLEISRASVVLRGLLKTKDEVKALDFFPALQALTELPLVGDQFDFLENIAKAELELTGGVGGRFPIDTTSGEILFAPSALELVGRSGGKISVDLLLATLDTSVLGDLTATWDLTGENIALKDVVYTTTGKAKATLLDFEWTDEQVDTFTWPETPEKSKVTSKGSGSKTGLSLVDPGFLELGDYAVFRPGAPAPRKNSPGDSANSPVPPSETLIGNVYPHAHPVVAEHGGTRLLAYVHYEPSRPDGQRTRLYFSVDAGTEFSTPAPVHEETRADFHPRLAFLPDGRALVVWQTSRLNQVASTVEERLSGLEVAWSLYDPTANTWSAPALLSDNNHLDHSPRMAASPQGPMVVWQSNVGNEVIGTAISPTQLHYATWDGAGFSTPNPLPASIQPEGETDLAFDGTEAIFTWINDEDGDPATNADTELYWSEFDGLEWSEPVRATNDAVADQRPRVFCLEDESFELLWTKGVDLVRMADFTTLTHQVARKSSPLAPPPQYDVSCDAQGRIVLLWSVFDEGEVNLRYAVLESTNHAWSQELFLTRHAGTEKAPTFSLGADGSLFAAFLREDVETGQHDLLWLEDEIGIDLTIGPIALEPGGDPDQFRIETEFRNIGGAPANNITVDFHLGDPETGGTFLASQLIGLDGGSKCEVYVSTTNLPPGADGQIFVRIDPSNVIVETDESNNTATTDLNPVDLVAENLLWERSADGDLLTLTGTVHNKGRTTQSGIPVKITGEQGDLLIATIPSLPPGTRVEVPGVLATATAFPTDDNLFTLKVDPEDTLKDVDRQDNDYSLPLTLREPGSFTPDSDGDNILDSWELANFGTLDRDGTGDFDGDRLSDYFESLTLTNPTDPDSRFEITVDPNPGLSGDVFITFPTEPGINYRLQRSNDLNTWLDLSVHPGTGAPVTVPATGFTAPEGTRSNLSSFRVRVEPGTP